MPTLYDPYGHRVDLSALRREHSDPQDDPSHRSAQRDDVASVIDPVRLAVLLRAADDGDPVAYLTLADEMEERELHYAACLAQRKNAITGAQVAVEAASDSAEHQRHADLVRELVRGPAFPDLVFDLTDAIGKGYSIAETIWETDSPDGLWWPRSWRWRDPRWFQLDPTTLEVSSLHDGTAEGSPLPPYKYVVHRSRRKSGPPVRGGLARVAAVAYCLKRYTIQQLVRFLEVYGIPVRLGKYRRGASSQDKIELLRMLKKLGSDASAIIPDDVTVELVEGQRSGRGGGAEGFIATANYWDSQVSKVTLGQTMTTDEGASFSQSKTHNTVRVSFAAHDCRFVGADVNRDVVRPFIDVNYGVQDRYPRVQLTVIEREDLEAFASAVSTFVDRGLSVDQRTIRTRLGLPEPEPGAALLTPPPMGFNDPRVPADDGGGDE